MKAGNRPGVFYVRLKSDVVIRPENMDVDKNNICVVPFIDGMYVLVCDLYPSDRKKKGLIRIVPADHVVRL